MLKAIPLRIPGSNGSDRGLRTRTAAFPPPLPALEMLISDRLLPFPPSSASLDRYPGSQTSATRSISRLQDGAGIPCGCGNSVRSARSREDQASASSRARGDKNPTREQANPGDRFRCQMLYAGTLASDPAKLSLFCRRNGFERYPCLADLRFPPPGSRLPRLYGFVVLVSR
jgi:hypothetical protein